MPRPTIDLDAHKDMVIEQYQNNISASDIVETLQSQCSIKIKPRTIQRRLQSWNQTQGKREITTDTPQLRMRIATLFVECQLEDKDILDV